MMWDEGEFVVVPRMIVSLGTTAAACTMTSENEHPTSQADAGLSISRMHSKLTPALYYTKQKSGIYDTHGYICIAFLTIVMSSNALFVLEGLSCLLMNAVLS